MHEERFVGRVSCGWGDDDSGTQGNDVIESIDLVLRRVQMPREQF